MDWIPIPIPILQYKDESYIFDNQPSTYDDKSYTRVAYYLLVNRNKIAQNKLNYFFASCHRKKVTEKIDNITGISQLPLEIQQIITKFSYQQSLIEFQTDAFLKFKDSIIPSLLTQNLHPNAKQLFKKDLLSLINNQEVPIICHKKYVQPSPSLNPYIKNSYYKNSLQQDRKDNLKNIINFFNSQKTQIDLEMENLLRDLYIKELNKGKGTIYCIEEKIKHIKDLPLILKLSEVHNFLSLIHNNNNKIYDGTDIKDHIHTENLDIDINVLMLLNQQQYDYIYRLRDGNDKNSQLIKVSLAWVNDEWVNYDTYARVNDTIKNIKIDIADNPSSLLRKLCDNLFLIHIPLMISSLMPDVMMYYVKNYAITSGCNAIAAGLLSPFISIFACGFSSYHIGEYLFPRLDNYHSDIAWLQLFFGNKVKKNIKRGDSFFNSTLAQWFLTCFSQLLIICKDTPLELIGYLIYFAKIPCYLLSANYMTWQRPIDRGVPNDKNKDQPYCLAHLNIWPYAQ